MAIEDWIDWEDGPPEPFSAICKYCGKGELEWYEDFPAGKKPRLVNRKGELHVCPEYNKAHSLLVPIPERGRGLFIDFRPRRSVSQNRIGQNSHPPSRPGKTPGDRWEDAGGWFS